MKEFRYAGRMLLQLPPEQTTTKRPMPMALIRLAALDVMIAPGLQDLKDMGVFEFAINAENLGRLIGELTVWRAELEAMPLMPHPEPPTASPSEDR